MLGPSQRVERFRLSFRDMNDPETVDQLVRWTARAAMLGLALAPAYSRLGRSRAALTCYVAGWLVYLIHVGCAFALVHGWSHRAAYEHTAQASAELIGWSWGGGLWFNYLFTAVWTFDVVWRLSAPRSYARRAWPIDVAVYGFLLFMAFNAVVVFGPPTTRAVGIAATMGLLVLAYRSTRNSAR